MLPQSSCSNPQFPPSMTDSYPRPGRPLLEQPWLDAASLSLTSSVVLSSNLLAALEGAPLQCSTLQQGLVGEILPLFDKGLEDFWSSSQEKAGLEDFWEMAKGQGGRDMLAMQQMLSCSEEEGKDEKKTVFWNNSLNDKEKDETQYEDTVLFQRDEEESVVISDDEETIPFNLDVDTRPNQIPSVLPDSHDCDLTLLYLPQLACNQEGQFVQEEELVCTTEGRPSKKKKLASARQGRHGPEKELACTQDGQFDQEEELACTRKGRPGQEEELACTQEGQSGQKEELASTREGWPGQGSQRKLEDGQDTGPRKRICTGY